MTPTLRRIAADITDFIRQEDWPDTRFTELALELFAFQFEHNAPYRRFCQGAGFKEARVADWEAIPAIPAAAFRELDLTVLAPACRSTEFHSSGTTEQRRARHFHSQESLSVYEASLLRWNEAHLELARAPLPKLIFLAPPPDAAPHSSLVYMMETLRCAHPEHAAGFFSSPAADGTWDLCPDEILAALDSPAPIALLGTAFGFVHLLDHLASARRTFALPAGSRIMETGGYKGRSRTLPREELHVALAATLGIPRSHIVSEYGMSELSSQAYDVSLTSPEAPRIFRFPPWARARITSPETGREVPDGSPGLVRVFDLANVASVLAVQTEDLAIRRGDGFELIGRAPAAEPRGCSLMTA